MAKQDNGIVVLVAIVWWLSRKSNAAVQASADGGVSDGAKDKAIRAAASAAASARDAATTTLDLLAPITRLVP